MAKGKEVSEWRIESDLNTLMEAEKIKADKARFAAAQKLAKERLAAVAVVASAAKDA